MHATCPWDPPFELFQWAVSIYNSMDPNSMWWPNSLGAYFQKRFLPGRAMFSDDRILEFDEVVMATGYQSNVTYWLQGADFFSKDGIPKAQFPNSWKGKHGLYAVGFTRRGLAGASSDAVKVAKDLGEAWKEETKQAKRLVSCHRRCISQIY